MKKAAAKHSSAVLSFLASAIVKPASLFYVHAPKVPQELLKK